VTTLAPSHAHTLRSRWELGAVLALWTVVGFAGLAFGQRYFLNTQLRSALDSARLSSVREAVERGAAIETATNDGRSALFLAAQAGDAGLVRMLLGRQARIDHATSMGWTPLMAAVASGHQDVARLLLDQGAAIDARNAQGMLVSIYVPGFRTLKYATGGQTALLLAVSNSRTDVARLLLERGADPRAGDRLGVAPLLPACATAQRTTVDELLSRGADPNACPRFGGTPLMWAAARGDATVVRALLRHGATLKAVNDGDGHSALDFAVLAGQVATARALLEAGAAVNVADAQGRTPLMQAVSRRNLRLTRLLRRYGARPPTTP
jgi:ankyrin repeat protein